MRIEKKLKETSDPLPSFSPLHITIPREKWLCASSAAPEEICLCDSLERSCLLGWLARASGVSTEELRSAESWESLLEIPPCLCDARFTSLLAQLNDDAWGWLQESDGLSQTERETALAALCLERNISVSFAGEFQNITLSVALAGETLQTQLPQLLQTAAAAA